MKSENIRPVIGVFDSGFGGLTVLKELVSVVSDADYLYFGDTARLPYGSKSATTVAHYAISCARFIEQRGASMLVVACNTASALALDAVRQAITIPVIGVIEPGAASAAAASKTKVVHVIATTATVSSHAYKRALGDRGVLGIEKACPLFVPLVEEGWVDHPVTEQVARIYMQEVAAGDGGEQDGDEKRADVLVLGCTHYPLLRPVLRRIIPSHVRIIDSAEATAHLVAGKLGISIGARHMNSPAAVLRFFATDSVDKFGTLGARFLGRTIDQVELVNFGD